MLIIKQSNRVLCYSTCC